MMHRFDIEHRHDGSIRVTCGDHHADSEHGLARKLVNAGAADGPIEAGRVGHVDYRVKSLHAFAAVSLSEGENGFSLGVYKPHPNAQVSEALQHAVSSLVVTLKNRRERSGRYPSRAEGGEAASAAPVGDGDFAP